MALLISLYQTRQNYLIPFVWYLSHYCIELFLKIHLAFNEDTDKLRFMILQQLIIDHVVHVKWNFFLYNVKM